ncbi:Site-specific DNA methylase protein [Allorhizobium ampelinum S4]|uniref:Site-specific DNA methylase protein n=1 Tax=Allorhizobium ampelinum (strain ATCC BAA-846 / DSM 112012 / S4) TaxID=311402 RepID=B9JYW8_ALLAM|nr:Site-specific DNA methylase protein [Allorhizobium ampelinum S4]
MCEQRWLVFSRSLSARPFFPYIWIDDKCHLSAARQLLCRVLRLVLALPAPTTGRAVFGLEFLYPQFIDILKFQITSRREFEHLKACDPATLTDLERAARFIYLQKLTFGGKVAGQTFGVQHEGSARFNLTRLAPLLEDVHERLSGVVIENLDWLASINRYDRPGVLFYLDPPYFGCEDDYGKALFGRDQFEVLAGRLKTLRGRFILSLNAVQGVFETFEAFHIEEVDCTYSVAGGNNSKSVKEVVITNFPS